MDDRIVKHTFNNNQTEEFKILDTANTLHLNVFGRYLILEYHPKGKRHGTGIPVTKSVLDALNEMWAEIETEKDALVNQWKKELEEENPLPVPKGAKQ